MKVAVCGTGSVQDQKVAQAAFTIGKLLAKKDVLILTGAGNGYPYEAVKGAASVQGRVMGISPASSRVEHESVYNFPINEFTHIEYTGLGIPARNLPLVKEADAVMVIGGNAGTLHELALALQYKKWLAVLKKSGGIAEQGHAIVEACNVSADKIIFSSDPKSLVEMLLVSM